MLELVHGNRSAWLTTNGLFIVAAMLTIAGLGSLTVILCNAGDGVFANPALLIFLIGTVLWISALALRLRVTVWAAAEMTGASAPPPQFEPLNLWSESLLDVYMVLAYIAIALYGGGLLRAEVLPDWLGWTSVVVGILAALSFVIRLPLFIFLIPAGTYIMPLVIGIVLLRSG